LQNTPFTQTYFVRQADVDRQAWSCFPLKLFRNERGACGRGSSWSGFFSVLWGIWQRCGGQITTISV